MLDQVTPEDPHSQASRVNLALNLFSNIHVPTRGSQFSITDPVFLIVNTFIAIFRPHDDKTSQTPQGEQRHRKNGSQEKRHTRQAESRNCAENDCSCSSIESRGETGSYR